MINVLLAIQVNQLESFLDNWKFDVDGNRLVTSFAPFQATPESPTIDVYQPQFCLVPKTPQGSWKIDDSGANNKQLVSIYIADIVELDWTAPQDPTPAEVLTVLHYLREAFAGALTIMGAWDTNGLQHGQTLIPATYDPEGVEIAPEAITGQPTYPLMPQVDALKYMPDDVGYDASGVEISRTLASTPKQVNLIYGQKDRQF